MRARHLGGRLTHNVLSFRLRESIGIQVWGVAALLSLCCHALAVPLPSLWLHSYSPALVSSQSHLKGANFAFYQHVAALCGSFCFLQSGRAGDVGASTASGVADVESDYLDAREHLDVTKTREVRPPGPCTSAR